MTHPPASPGSESGTVPEWARPTRRSCCLGCLAVPVVCLLILSVYATVQSYQSGRFVPFPEVTATSVWEAEGLPGENVGGWWSEEQIVHASEGGLTAVATDDGEELWQLETDAGVCDLAEAPVAGVGIVLLEGEHVDPDPLDEDDPQRSCDSVMGVDLTDGTELWRAGPFFESGDPGDRYNDAVDTSAHEDGVVIRVDNELRGLDPSDGSQTWSREELTVDDDSCPAVDLAPRDATHATALGDCGVGGQISVHTVDAGAGEDSTAFAYERGPDELDEDLGSSVLVSTDPVVVRLDLGHRRGPERDHDPDLTESGRDDPYWEQTLVFDDEGALATALEERYRILDEHVDGEPPVLPAGDRLYMGTGDPGCTDAVQSHDLSNGEELWETSMSGTNHLPVAVQGDRLLMIRGEDYEHGKCTFLVSPREWQFYVLDTETGDAEPLTQQVSRYDRPEPDQVWWHGEHVYFFEKRRWDDASSVVAF